MIRHPLKGADEEKVQLVVAATKETKICMKPPGYSNNYLFSKLKYPQEIMTYITF